MIKIIDIIPQEKGKVKISFDSADDIVLYKSELRSLALEEQMELEEDTYHQIYYEIVGKRVTKRAMHLLEKMDRTEVQLRKKLMESDYPQELVERAIAYVKSYRYIDDERYANTFVRLNQERKSKARIRQDLLSRGVASHLIDNALSEDETDQEVLIAKLLEKKQYDPDTATLKDAQKMYQFLMRRGFLHSEIMHALHKG